MRRLALAFAALLVLGGCAAATRPAPATAPAPHHTPAPPAATPRPRAAAPRAAVDSLPSAEALAVLATIPDPQGDAPAAVPSAPAPAPTRAVTPPPAPANAPADTVAPAAADTAVVPVPVPAPTTPLGQSAPATAPASAPSEAAAPPPSAAAPDTCWRVQVAAPLERDKGKAMRDAAESLLLVPMIVDREAGRFKVRSRDCLERPAAESLRDRAVANGFKGVFLVMVVR